MTQSNQNALPRWTSVHWYEITGVLGQGGFGITYLARDTNLDQQVALKEYFPVGLVTRATDGRLVAVSEEAEADFRWGLERFVNEARTLAKFDHPNIVRVFTVFDANDTAYMVMRFEQGAPLSEVLKEKSFTEAELKQIVLALIDGLGAVHEAGFIHRDIKPANIYLRGDGSPVLLDFGSARQALGGQTQTLTSMVSPGYAPYEQYMSDAGHQGAWTDIYALGATLYRAVSGTSPMAAVDRSKPILHGAGDYLTPLGDLADERFSPGFLAAIEHALAFHEAERPQTLAAWREEILHGVVSAGPPAAAPELSTVASEAQTQKLDTVAGDITTAARGRSPVVTWTMIIVAALLVGFMSVWAGLKLLKHRGNATEVPVAVVAGPAAAPVPRAAGVTAAPATSAQPTVAELLAQAQADMRADRLTTPAGNNAYERYREVLARDPGNADAREGMTAIMRRYMALASAAARDKDWQRVRALLAKARRIDPENPQISRIESRLEQLMRQQAR